jgi:tetratricopeptide (TPR) repeat protein
VEQYRDNPKPTPVVAEEMNVSYVLEGSGQKIGNRVLLIVQLINGATDEHVWSKQYDREIQEVEDLIDIQVEIAKSVAGEIKAIITPEEKVLIEKVPTISLTAYDFYQRGNEELFLGDGEGSLLRAEQLFHEALRYDSTFAEAYVGLAWIYWRHYWEDIFEADMLDSVRILADKTLSIDTNLSNAYTIRGYYFNQVGDHDKAIKEFDRAIELNPNNNRAYRLGSQLYANTDLVKSLQYAHNYMALNRGGQLPTMLQQLGYVYLYAGFIEKSRYYYSEAYALTNNLQGYYVGLRNCEYVSGNFSVTVEYQKKCGHWILRTSLGSFFWRILYDEW